MASGRNIRAGGAYVDLYTEDRRLVRGLAMAQRRLQAFAAGATAMGKKLMTASAAVIAPLTLSVRHFMRTGDALDKMSHRVGASVEFLSALGHAAQIGGTDISAMEVGIRRMQRTAMDATRGLSTATDAFDELGMSVVDSEGKLKTTEALFMESAAALSKLDNNTRKAALSTMIFGRAGTSLLPMLLQGKEGLLAVMEEAKRLGVVISTDQARAAAAFTDVWTRLVSVLKMVVFEVGSALVPKLEELVPKIMETAQGVRAWIRENGEAILYAAKLAAKIALVGAGLVGLGMVLNATSVILGTAAMAVKGLSVAFTFLLAHPVVAALAGITIAAIALGHALNKLFDDTVKLNDEMSKTLEKGDRQRADHQGLMDRLQQLAQKTSLTTAEQKEARGIIRQLETAYGDLGLSIDSATGALEGFIAAQKKQKHRSDEDKRYDIRKAMAEREENIQKLIPQIAGSRLTRVGERFSLGDGGAREDAVIDRIAVERKAWRDLFEDLKNLGDKPAIVGGAAPDLEPVKAQKVLDFEEKLARTIAELRIKAAKKGLDEELALLNFRYHEEMVLAEQLGTYRATQAARAAVREKHALQETEIRERHARETKARQEPIREELKRRRQEKREDVEAQRQDRQFELARLQIQAGKKGLERDLALLDLDEQRALAGGEDPEHAAKKFALLRKLARQRGDLAAADPTTTARGTFSAFGARGLASAGPLDKIAKTNQQIVANTHEIAIKMKRRVFT